ncbi:BTB/POZ domain containing protein [Lasiodiplodia theobromae]|uniref:BTB/POZ domain-containing protein 3 n=1 Tax=Lasiodiplodia theobromae TaxID=45133 RepID=A0A5N5DMV7_9PEZI|nr:BTB/POZ domain containing protein [Lasiodiplodia theobromae]KAB2579255.1 BTB/POZ domain-containing protein 3 [Lasiodiplodia theobromae]KAF4537421.1 BTB/POZ domain containing protein [Lasiodiplodia theobromae]
MVVPKHELEAALHEENKAIRAGQLKEDNPLDTSDDFRRLCDACRRGDLKLCQEQLSKGVNINARDQFDYTPLILASLCGHYEVVQHLLESGALCERDTFQGERCLYNALNDRIRNLLLSYDYSKSTDPLQPFAAHLASLLTRESPNTSDITVVTADRALPLHKFILAARSPYFAKKLADAPETKTTNFTSEKIAPQSLESVIRYLYFADINADFGDGEEEQIILTGIDKLGKKLQIEHLFQQVLESNDRRLARQRRQDEVHRGRDQMESWFKDHVLKHKIVLDTAKADSVKWDRDNRIFADVLLRADEDYEDEEDDVTPTPSTPDSDAPRVRNTLGPLNGIPIGPIARSRSPSRQRNPRKSVLYPVHRAMLIRSEFFQTMFSSGFREAQETPYLQVIPIDCSPRVLEIVLKFLYTERADFPLDVAIDVLFTADLLWLEKLKVRAAQIISTLGNGNTSIVESENPRGETADEEEEPLDIYDVIRAGWDTRVQRLEEFGARYIAHRLERYIDDPEFAELVRESANRVKARQETDTVELIDDIRYYLSERFRLRFEDSGLEEMMDEEGELDPEAVAAAAAQNAKDGVSKGPDDAAAPTKEMGGLKLSSDASVIRTLDGEIAGDEFAQDAINYQILLGKIDRLLDSLKLDA